MVIGGVWLAGCPGRFYTENVCPDGVEKLPFEILGDEIDNDCDSLVDELPMGGPNSRSHCGAMHRPCSLPPGADDVACVDGKCVGIYASGAPRPGETNCFDGIDDDADGIIDNGSACEVLVANVASSDCHGADRDRRDCPPTASLMGAGTGGDETPISTVYFTYDYLVDRFEATNAQVCQFRSGGSSESTPNQNDYCARPAEFPATDLSWCDAAALCQWMNKRLPTEAEWERMARGTRRDHPRPFPWQFGAPDDRDHCAGCPIECDFHPAARPCSAAGWLAGELRPSTSTGGWAQVGSERAFNVGGNASEWVYDEYFGSYAGLDVWNRVRHAETATSSATRILRGGSYDWKVASTAATNRIPVLGGGAHRSFGVRCARDFRPAASPIVPRDLATNRCRSVSGTSEPIKGRVYLADVVVPRELRCSDFALRIQPVIKNDYRIAMALVDTPDGFTQVTVGQAVRTASGAEWARDLQRASGIISECTAASCEVSVEHFDTSTNRVDLDFDVLFLPLHFLSAAPLATGWPSTCTDHQAVPRPPPEPGEIAVAFQVAVSKQETDGSRYVLGESITELLCTNDFSCGRSPANTGYCMECEGDCGDAGARCPVVPYVGNDCIKGCQRWFPTFDMLFRPLAAGP